MAGKKKHINPKAECARLRGLSLEELQKLLAEEREKLMKDRFEHAAATLEDTALLPTTRRQIARILTIMTEKREAV